VVEHRDKAHLAPLLQSPAQQRQMLRERLLFRQCH
jgi:hypothetical protein